MASAAPLSDLPVSIADIRAAARRIAGAVVRTPTMRSGTLSQLTGAEVYLKFENLQFTAAFKERGALNKLLLMDQATRERGVIAASAGNHSQGLAYHAARLNIPVTIVMPVPTPIIKVMQTEGHGATVVLHGETFDEANAHALGLAKARKLTFVHPFDDLEIIAGQGTLALEMLEDAPAIDTLIVPVGGGGLMSG
ncbi:MAG TPA: pyridoxal-phosphate dependent enzyme, partial [Vineibacter sp.]|nr:pyridoxal-phosphate dependent enzyme [Vineibacter sp.]